MAAKRRTKRSEPVKHSNAREVLKKVEELANKPKYVPQVGDHVRILSDCYICGNAVKMKEKNSGLYVRQYNNENDVATLCYINGEIVDAVFSKDIEPFEEEQPGEEKEADEDNQAEHSDT